MNRFPARFVLTVLLSATASTSCAADSEDAARARYGEAAYLFAGAGCDVRGMTYVQIDRAEFFEGTHRLAMKDTGSMAWASDVYIDKIALPDEPARRALYEAIIDKPVYARVAGWRKDCGGANIIFLVDKLQLLS